MDFADIVIDRFQLARPIGAIWRRLAPVPFFRRGPEIWEWYQRYEWCLEKLEKKGCVLEPTPEQGPNFDKPTCYIPPAPANSNLDKEGARDRIDKIAECMAMNMESVSKTVLGAERVQRAAGQWFGHTGHSLRQSFLSRLRSLSPTKRSSKASTRSPAMTSPSHINPRSSMTFATMPPLRDTRVSPSRTPTPSKARARDSTIRASPAKTPTRTSFWRRSGRSEEHRI